MDPFREELDEEFDVTPIEADIICFRFQSNKTLAYAMCRIQEHYESPFPEIKGKVFTLGQLRSVGSSSHKGLSLYEGGNHFGALFSGYNWPSYALDPFIKGMFDPLTSYEQDIVNILKYRNSDYYAIGVSEDLESDLTPVLKHEICHALYYLSSSYRKEAHIILQRMESTHQTVTKMRSYLQEAGYHPDVFMDETNAYLTEDSEWLKASGYADIHGISFDEDDIAELRSIKDIYYARKYGRTEEEALTSSD